MESLLFIATVLRIPFLCHFLYYIRKWQYFPSIFILNLFFSLTACSHSILNRLFNYKTEISRYSPIFVSNTEYLLSYTLYRFPVSFLRLFLKFILDLISFFKVINVLPINFFKNWLYRYFPYLGIYFITFLSFWIIKVSIALMLIITISVVLSFFIMFIPRRHQKVLYGVLLTGNKYVKNQTCSF